MLSRQPRGNFPNRQRKQALAPTDATTINQPPTPPASQAAPSITSPLQFIPSSIPGVANKRPGTPNNTITSPSTTLPEILRPGAQNRRNTQDQISSPPLTPFSPITTRNTDVAPGTDVTETPKPRLNGRGTRRRPLGRSSSSTSSASSQKSSSTSNQPTGVDAVGPTLAEELDSMLLDSTVHQKNELLKEDVAHLDEAQLHKLHQEIDDAHREQEKLITTLESIRGDRDRLRLELEGSMRGREHLEEDLRIGEEEIKKLHDEKEEFRRSLVDLAQKLEAMEVIIQEETEQARKSAEGEKRALEKAKNEAEERVQMLLAEKKMIEEERDKLKEDMTKVWDETERTKEELSTANQRVEELESDLEKLKDENAHIEEEKSRIEVDKARAEEDRLVVEEKRVTFEKEQEKLRRDLASAIEGRIFMQKKEESARESQIIAEKRALEERRARVKAEEALKQMESKMKDVAQLSEVNRRSQEERVRNEDDWRNAQGSTSSSQDDQIVVQSWNKAAEKTLQMVYTRFQGFQTMLPGAAASPSPLARFWGKSDTNNGMTAGREGMQRNRVLVTVKAAEEEVKRATAALSEAIRNLDLAERQAEREGLRRASAGTK